VAYALSLLAATSELDPHGRPVPRFDVDVKEGVAPLEKPRLRIVRFQKWSRVEPDQQKMFEAAAAKLRDAGAVVEEREWEELDATNWSTVNTILSSEAALIYSDLVENYPDRTSDHLKSAVKAGKALTAFDYLAARSLQEKLRAALTAEMSGVDAVLTVPAFGEAPEGLGSTGNAEYCAPWTLLGAPALSLPAGFGKNGLPLGIQIVGSYRQDLHLLRVAKWIEGALAFDPGMPKIAAG
jgi:Asp-tRNA(Asn)/Glu-tRNA(Gln) amidotransferase A subunit family amidase